MGCKVLGCVLLVLLMLPFGYAATLSGGVYDAELNAITGVVLFVNSTPIQRHVSKFGGFQFALDPGTYNITVNFTKNGITRTIADDQVAILDDEGEYRRDIFVYTDIDFDRDFNQTIIAEQQRQEQDSSQLFVLVGSIIAFVILIIAALIFMSKRNRPQKSVDVDDVVKDSIISLLQERGGQASQKYIRSKMPSSESKISMLLTGLEKDGVIQKVKKGRVNMIVLKK